MLHIPARAYCLECLSTKIIQGVLRTRCFQVQGRKKIALVQLFTEMNLTVIISDVDTVWMRNPFPYFKAYPEADVLTSSDHLQFTVTDEGLEDWRKAGSAYNIGIMLFSPKSVEFARAWVEWIERDAKVWDQDAFNQCVLYPVLLKLKHQCCRFSRNTD